MKTLRRNIWGFAYFVMVIVFVTDALNGKPTMADLGVMLGALALWRLDTNG